MDPYLVSGVMPYYAVVTVDHCPYVILIHPAISYIDSIPFSTIRQYDRNRLFEFKHHLKLRYNTRIQNKRHDPMTVA